MTTRGYTGLTNLEVENINITGDITLTDDATFGDDVSIAGDLTVTTSLTSTNGIKIPTTKGIYDAGGDEYVTFTEGTTPVTYVNITSGNTGVSPKIRGAGETNTDLTLYGTGTGNVYIGDGADVTKDLTFELSGATTAKTMTIVSSQTADRSLTLPDATGTLVHYSSDGQMNVDTTISAGANVGHVIKMTGAAAGTYTGTNCALTVKNYDADGTVVHSGGENGGLSVWAKFLSEPTDGGENVIATFHQHSSSTANPKHGIVVYGDMTNGFALTGGTATQALSLENQTLTYLAKLADSGAVVTNALVPAAAPDAGTMGADRAIAIDIGGTAYYIPLYDTLHA